MLTDIVSVADFIDEICNPGENYQCETVSPEEMLEQLRTFAGVRFSPFVAEAAVRREKEIKKY